METNKLNEVCKERKKIVGVGPESFVLKAYFNQSKCNGTTRWVEMEWTQPYMLWQCEEKLPDVKIMMIKWNFNVKKMLKMKWQWRPWFSSLGYYLFIFVNKNTINIFVI